MTPIAIRSVAQREKFQRVATGEEISVGLSPELARASLEAHGVGVLPERVVKPRSEKIRTRRLRRR